MRGIRRATALVVAAGLAMGCSADPSSPADGNAAAPSVTPSGTPDPPRAGSTVSPGSATPAPAATGSTRPAPTDAPVDPVSLPALFERRYVGGDLRVRRVVARTDAYTSYSVSYRSNRLRVSGKLDVPRGRGPFPAVVLAHGYIDPDLYANGQGMRREQDWLARAGYVVLHTDYRNHAFSSADPGAERRFRLGYTVDTINAVNTLRSTRFAPVDDERVGLVGRSMGGGVVYNVLAVRPGLVDAAVVFAPVSSRAADNFERWIRPDPARGALTRRILREHGGPRQNARFWREVSPRHYLGRVTEPVLIHHGTADETCPLRWSRATLRAMRAAGVDARLRTYAGEPHAFLAAWPLAMRRTETFLAAHL
ncbi:MAG: alpha/beta fold hydrolase [Nocardioidaceae bacterium]